jgi:hypothetical protein
MLSSINAVKHLSEQLKEYESSAVYMDKKGKAIPVAGHDGGP